MINKRKLEGEIFNSTKDIEKIKESLKEINSNTIFIGSGGSRVVAEFAAKVLEKKNKIITRTMDVSDLYHANLENFANIFIASYSGSNFGVKASFIENKTIYLLSNRKTNISNERLLHYEMTKEDSFISLIATIIPMAILLNYYLDDKFAIILSEIINVIDEELSFELNGNFLNVFTGCNTRTCDSFLETTLTEAGLTIPLLHDKYSYCHGRSTINKEHQESAIYLGHKGNDLDKALENIIKSTMSSSLVMKDKFNDDIVNDFYLTLQSMYLINNISKGKKINLASIKYDKEAVKNLYYFKGSM